MINEIDYTSKKVIILDDTELWLDTMKIWLRKLGYKHIDYCSTSKQFLDVFDKSYDVVVIDYFLEGDIEAPQVIKKARKINKDAFILCASGLFTKQGNVNFEKMTLALSAGANRAVSKDVDAIQDILDSHMSLREHNDFNIEDPFSFDFQKLST